jgi:hypothetical protein
LMKPVNLGLDKFAAYLEKKKLYEWQFRTDFGAKILTEMSKTCIIRYIKSRVVLATRPL